MIFEKLTGHKHVHSHGIDEADHCHHVDEVSQPIESRKHSISEEAIDTQKDEGKEFSNNVL